MTLVATGTTSASAAAHNPAATVSGKKVTLVWWNNATTGTLLNVFNNAIKAFDAANPNVTIQNVPIQNEVLQNTKIPLALQATTSLISSSSGAAAAKRPKSPRASSWT